jgi:molecular chaperone Hsp33
LSSPRDIVPDDLVQPFQIDPFALRGRLVRLGPAIDRILSQHAYPEPVAAMLGEAITLAVVLAGALKYDGIFTLQTKGDGPIRLIVADVSTDGALRGYAQYDEAKLDAFGDDAEPAARSVSRLLGAGYIAFTVDQGEDTDRYQGIVELSGATLADCAQHYFRQSEQIQAGIKLAVARTATDPTGAGGAWRAGGLMLQRVPPEGGYGVIADDVEDGWRRAMVLMSSATEKELVDPGLSPHRLLFRLFHEDGVRVFDTHPLEARCRCSRRRIETILRAFPADELDDMRKELVTTVTCEFCSRRYTFDADEIGRLAAA